MKQSNLFISERISVNDDTEGLEVVISGKIPQNQFIMLSAWVLAWSISGIYVLIQLFGDLPQETKSFMMVWLAFWFYFEYKIGSAWLWRKYGREVIKIGKEKTQLRFEVAYGGKGFEFDTDSLRDFHLLESKKGVFIKNYFESFWVVGGESIGFYVSGKLKMFGRQLPEKDAEKLMRLIQAKVKRFSK